MIERTFIVDRSTPESFAIIMLYEQHQPGSWELSHASNVVVTVSTIHNADQCLYSIAMAPSASLTAAFNALTGSNGTPG